NATHVSRTTEQSRRPCVQVWFGGSAKWKRRRFPTCPRRSFAPETCAQPMRVSRARARRLYHVEVGRWRLSAGDRLDGVRRTQRVAAHYLINAFTHQRIAER